MMNKSTCGVIIQECKDTFSFSCGEGVGKGRGGGVGLGGRALLVVRIECQIICEQMLYSLGRFQLCNGSFYVP